MPDAEYIEKLRSLGFSRPRDRRPNVTVDEHSEAHSVAVTEHWNDRVDVAVCNPEVTVNPALVAKEYE